MTLAWIKCLFWWPTENLLFATLQWTQNEGFLLFCHQETLLRMELIQSDEDWYHWHILWQKQLNRQNKKNNTQNKDLLSE